MPDHLPSMRRFGDYAFDEADARLSRGHASIALAPKALAVLQVLLRQPGRLVSKEALLDAVWGHRHVSESVLKSVISQLRSALGDSARQPRYIETASRHGYRFVAAVESGMPPAATSPYREARQARGRAVLMVGREAALSQLDAAWHAALRGERQMVWLAGEAGIGKSTVCDAFLATRTDAVCARGQCVEPRDSGEPYLPILEALAERCRHDDVAIAHLRQVAPTWLRQLPWLQQATDAAPGAMPTGTGQDGMLREIGELLDRLASEKPLLLVLEDLHWADAATARLLDYLARRRSTCQLMILGTYRPDEMQALDRPLRAVRHELVAHRLCREIALPPLSHADLASWLASRNPPIPTQPAMIDALHAHTDGLPLFVQHVLDDLQRLHAGTDRPSPAVESLLALRDSVPDDLTGLIETQFLRLDPAWRPLLSAASVRGMVFGLREVAEALEMEPAVAADILAQLALGGTWIAPHDVSRLADGSLRSRYVFRHALYRHVLYRRIDPARRAAWHQGIAIALAAMPAGSESTAEIATHYERGHDRRAAARAYATAATSALNQFAPADATALAARGLDLLQPGENALRFELKVTQAIAAAQQHGVASPPTLSALEQAQQAGEGLPLDAQRTWLCNGLGWAYFSRADYHHARRQAQDMQALALSSGDAMLAICGDNLFGASLCFSGSLAEAEQALRRGLARLPPTREDGAREIRSIVDLETSLRAYLAQVLASRGAAQQAREHAGAALARAQGLAHPMSESLAWRARCLVELRLGDVAQASDAAQRLAQLVELHAVPQALAPARWWRGWALARAGDPARGLDLISEGCDRLRAQGMRSGLALGHALAADALSAAHDAAGAERHAREGLSVARQLGETMELPFLSLLLSRSTAAQGRNEEAVATAGEALAAARQIEAQRDEIAALLALHRLSAADATLRAALQRAVAALPPHFDQALRADAESAASG